MTYTAKDIAYHLWKFGLLNEDFQYKRFSEGLWSTHSTGTDSSYDKADIVINVIDYRQQYPQAMVKQALDILGFTAQSEKLRHVSYGVVSLSPAAAKELGIAHARAVSILSKAENESNRTPLVPGEINQIEKAEHALLRQLANWQDTLYIAYTELTPSIVCNYAHELATLFNNFYASCPILKASDDQKAFRLWLTLQFKQSMSDALTVLGLPTPDRM